ncbi:hypothetical protein CCR82_03055 [Halochromatium salexigens]|uniref:DUF218 domain-containing protein n=1 Tax=Halochromatium salexigens TaxID=49447 RepID=A0AAJ0XFB5_HALSE|nr:hypothetical protein [Halochromatium salexigens]
MPEHGPRPAGKPLIPGTNRARLLRRPVKGWRQWLRRGLLFLVLGLVGMLAALVLVDLRISLATRDAITETLDEVEPTEVALILGTSRGQRGKPNRFYQARIEAAAALYHSGRVLGILVSGDNATRYYNEPIAMQRDLMALGVPGEHITLDYAGFRTLDSMVRAKEVFGLDRVLVVSQRFHLARAIFLARRFGLNAHGFAAADPPHLGYVRVRAREILARSAAVLDLLTGQGPRFLGARETVRLQGEPQHDFPASDSARSKQQPDDQTDERQQEDHDDPKHLGQGASAALDDLDKGVDHNDQV